MFFTDFLSNVLVSYLGVFSNIIPTLLENSITDESVKKIGAGLAAIGVIGTGVGQGNAGAGACMAIGRNPEVSGKITTAMIISAGIAESAAIYALLIALLILFVG